MRKLLEQAREQLRAFLDQRSRLVLVVRCADSDAAMLMKLIEGIDRSSTEDLFVQIGGAFEDERSYLQAAAAQLQEEHRLASQAVVESGRSPLPAFPEELLDARLPPPERLERMVIFANELLPKDARRFVFTLIPDRIVDRPAYWKLLARLMPAQGLEHLKPWARRARIIVRDERVEEPTHPLVGLAPELIGVMNLDFGPAAMEAAMNDEVDDEKLPMDARMQALLGLAIRDSAFGRAEPATEKLNYLLGYYQQSKDLVMQSLVMNTLGDVFLRLGSMDQAQHWYECALGAAVDATHPVMLATVTKNLGSLSLASGRYADAEQYFQGLDQIASKMLDAETKAWALEWRGVSQQRLGRMSDAVASWEASASLSRNTDQPHMLPTCLERLHQAYSEAGLVDRARVIGEELKRYG